MKTFPTSSSSSSASSSSSSSLLLTTTTAFVVVVPPRPSSMTLSLFFSSKKKKLKSPISLLRQQMDEYNNNKAFDLTSSAKSTRDTTVTTLDSSSSSSSSASASASSLSLSSSLLYEDDDEHQQHNNQFSLRRVLGIDDDDDDMLQRRGLFNNSSTSTSNRLLFPEIVGHRGCIYDELENTRQGFIKCNEMGCDSIELDVFKISSSSSRSSSNNNNTKNTSLGSEVIVFHGGGSDDNPGDLLDYCNVEGSILDFDLNTIGNLKFNPLYKEFTCPIEKIHNGTIPTLKEVLEDTKHYNNKHRRSTSPMKIKIELKGPDISIVDDVLTLVDELDMIDVCSYSSFDLQKLKLLRQIKPNKNLYKTGALFNNITKDGTIQDEYEYYGCNIVDCSIESGVTEIHLKYDTCYKKLIAKIHKAGFNTMGWMRGPIGMKYDISEKYYNDDDSNEGEENSKMYEILIQTGVQSLCINKPRTLIDIKNKYINE
jgi:glycerophosphoryl diester phosphodiesterase